MSSNLNNRYLLSLSDQIKNLSFFDSQSIVITSNRDMMRCGTFCMNITGPSQVGMYLVHQWQDGILPITGRPVYGPSLAGRLLAQHWSACIWPVSVRPTFCPSPVGSHLANHCRQTAFASLKVLWTATHILMAVQMWRQIVSSCKLMGKKSIMFLRRGTMVEQVWCGGRGGFPTQVGNKT